MIYYFYLNLLGYFLYKLLNLWGWGRGCDMVYHLLLYHYNHFLTLLWFNHKLIWINRLLFLTNLQVMVIEIKKDIFLYFIYSLNYQQF